MLSVSLQSLAQTWSKPLVRPEAVYEVRLVPASKRPLQVWKGGKMLDSYLKDSYKPWDLQITDVDGDGLPEIAIGVVRSTKSKPFDHRCIFIMRFDGKRLRKKWMGSGMGRTLLEFQFGPASKGHPAVLYTLERTLANKVALSAWSWSGFGFLKHRHELVWKSASGLKWAGNSLILRTGDGAINLPVADLL